MSVIITTPLLLMSVTITTLLLLVSVTITTPLLLMSVTITTPLLLMSVTMNTLLLLCHLHTFQLKVDLLHDQIKLIPVWLCWGYRMLLYPTPTSKLIEVFTGVHTHIKTLLQLCSYGGKQNITIRNNFCKLKHVFFSSETSHLCWNAKIMRYIYIYII